MFWFVTLSTQDNATLLHQLKSSFERTNIWNKYQSKVTIREINPYLNHLIELSFQGVNRFCALLFESNTDKTVQTKY